MGMDIRQLTYFMVIAEEGQITAMQDTSASRTDKEKKDEQ